MVSRVDAQIPFLASLSPESREAVLGLATQLKVPRGERMFSVGDPADQCYLILQGKVKLTRLARNQPQVVPHPQRKPTLPPRRRRIDPPPARESLLWLMGPGDMFGELSVFDQGTRSTAARTVTESVLLRFEADELAAMVNERPDVTSAMLAQLAMRLRRRDDQAAGMVLSDVPGRVAWLILHLHERFGVPGDPATGTPPSVRHDLTQSEIAQVVGASRETVNKALTDFENRGIIEVRPKEFRILQPQRLLARID